MFPEIPRPFNTQYKCFSVSMLPGTYRQDVERGGKSKEASKTKKIVTHDIFDTYMIIIIRFS